MHLKHMKILCGFLPALAFAGCAVSKSGNASSPPIELTATLLSPIDIQLQWHDRDTRVAWHTVEYANDTNGPFIILDFLPPHQTTFTHTNLMPHTPFYYRVRAIRGPASDPVVFTLPQGLSPEEYARRYEGNEDYSWAVPAAIPAAGKVTTASVRTAGNAARPTDFRASPATNTVSGFKLTWTDHASDEDGELLEVKPDGSRDYFVAALLRPNINMMGYAFAPPRRKADLRVRAFYYSSTSNTTGQTTGFPAR